MSYRFLTCPESAHLEMIEQEVHPLGLLIVACSRFRPPCRVECARTCARRLDRKARLDDSDNTPTVDDDVTSDDMPTESEITHLALLPHPPRPYGVDVDIETDLEIDSDLAREDETRLERWLAATAPR